MKKSELRIFYLQQQKSCIYEVKLVSILTDLIIGRNIERGVDKPKNLLFSDIKCDKNNPPLDNSSNSISYDLSWDFSHDLLHESSYNLLHDSYHYLSVESTQLLISDSVNGFVIELMHDCMKQKMIQWTIQWMIQRTIWIVRSEAAVSRCSSK